MEEDGQWTLRSLSGTKDLVFSFKVSKVAKNSTANCFTAKTPDLICPLILRYPSKFKCPTALEDKLTFGCRTKQKSQRKSWQKRVSLGCNWEYIYIFF